MRHRVSSRGRRGRRQRGQSTVEYIILAGLLLAGLAFLFTAFPNALRNFASGILLIFGLPIL